MQKPTREQWLTAITIIAIAGAIIYLSTIVFTMIVAEVNGQAVFYRPDAFTVVEIILVPIIIIVLLRTIIIVELPRLA